MSRQVSGAEFVLDAPTHVPAVWGAGSEVLWSQGEALILCGPQGVGKSTVAQQLIRARLEIAGEVLGRPVTPDARHVLYIAADRPQQAARSMRRMFTDTDRETLNRRLVVWRGSLPFNFVEKPEALRAYAESVQAGTVVIDSLKDIASPISEERVGHAVNTALQALIEAEIEVCALHHQRKATSENKRPRTLADVYGSTWVTAGTGSVVVLWGEAGDPVVELIHLKQPADEVGPLELVHDHHTGTTTVNQQTTPYELVQTATDGGITAKEVAARLHGPTPDRNHIEKARRKLDQLVHEGHAIKVEPRTANEPIRYRPIEKRVRPREGHREALTQPSRTLTNPHHNWSRDPHAPSHPTSDDPDPPIGGAGRDAVRPHTEETEQATIDRLIHTFDAEAIEGGASATDAPSPPPSATGSGRKGP